jgi:hypothetical protein
VIVAAASALAAALLAPSAPCPVALPSGAAVRGGFEPARAMPEFSIANREANPVLVKLEQADTGTDHVFYVAAGESADITFVTPATYHVSVAVAGRLGPDCRTLAAAKTIYRFSESFVFTRTVTENPYGTRDTAIGSHWIELGNNARRNAGSNDISVAAFND